MKEKGRMTPLKGIKVYELSEEIAGPFCAQQLSDSGAEVIKVEPITGDWSRQLGEKINGESALFLSLNRGKKSIALDLREAKAREIFQELVKNADVLIESFGPGRAEEMDIGYAQLSIDNPKLIYCAISPFGSSGPYAKYPASELELQGLAGYQYHLGQTGEPPVRIGADLVNTTTGMYSFIGILSALFNRNESGIGQKIDCAMMSNAIAMLCYVITADYNPDLPDGWHFTGPFDRPETGYQTKNGPVLFGMPMLPDKMQSAWEYFVRQIGLPELLDDPNFRKRGMRNVGIGRNAQEFKPAIEAGLKNYTKAEIKKIIGDLGGSSFAPFNTIQDVLDQPQVDAVNMIEVLQHPVAGEIKVTGIPWKLMDTPLNIQGAPPTLGQHTDEIMHNLGYSTQEIKSLRDKKIIA
jgi:CoA:oxalate CoA-transferase